jgi:hypothetical protein
MVKYNCKKCGKEFKQKSHWIRHIENKKFPCKQINIIILKEDLKEDLKNEEEFGSICDKNCEDLKNSEQKINKKVFCKFCMGEFSRSDNLKRHLDNNKCKILQLQKQQKENIFINLLEEEKINNETEIKLNKIANLDNDSSKNIKNKKNDSDQINLLIKQVNEMKKILEEQQK